MENVHRHGAAAEPPPSTDLNRLITGMPYEHYALAPGINQTGLTQMLHSGAKYKWHLDQRQAESPDEIEETEALVVGKITHLCILEPDVYQAKVVVRPDFRPLAKLTAKAQREVWEAELAADAVVVTPRQNEMAQRMRDAVWRNADARALLAKGKREASLWWRDGDYGQLCKARLDFVSSATSGGICMDLKTTDDASRLKFTRSVLAYRYDLQACHYMRGGQFSGQYSGRDFYFLAVEKKPPYSAVLYSLSDYMQSYGFKWWEEAMRLYCAAQKTNRWESLPAVDELGLPKWAKVPGEEDEAYE